jgi:hypothetical protein
MTVDGERDTAMLGTAEPAQTDNETANPLLGADELESFRERWKSVQAAFVDDPRATVKEADELVKDLVGRLSESFTQERASLESQWDRHADPSTEDLRMAMRRYRSFFIRLLAA